MSYNFAIPRLRRDGARSNVRQSSVLNAIPSSAAVIEKNTLFNLFVYFFHYLIYFEMMKWLNQK